LFLLCLIGCLRLGFQTKKSDLLDIVSEAEFTEACKKGNLELIKRTVTRQLELIRPLIVAIRENQLEVVKLLLSKQRAGRFF